MSALRLSGRARAFLIGGLIVAIGVTGSTFLASAWRSSSQRANKKSFESTVADLGSTLDAELQSKIELTHAMRSIATLEPNAGEERYMQWYRQLQHGAPTSPGVTAVFIQAVPASELPAFRAQAEADPTARKSLHGSFQIVPSGSRPFYCLTRATVGNTGGKTVYPSLLDYCAPVLPGIGKSPYAALIGMERTTGALIVTPLPGLGVASLVGISEAVYRSGAPLATVPERRAAFRGIIGTSFAGAELLRPLLAGHGSLTLALYHRNSGDPLELIGRAGAHPTSRSPGYAERLDIGEGWVVEVTGMADSPLAADAQGAIALAFGLLVTLLVFLLWRVLVRSRQRAWGLVGEKTDELEYRALHDPLTDLPNRILVLDRAEQILARGRRQDVPVTALFVDIDGFKQINDRFGHQAGDDLLRQVAARLVTVLRDSDTVGRVGGDEFAMLIDSAGVLATPELVAERDPRRVAPADPVAPVLTYTNLGDGEHRHRDREAGLGRGADAGRPPRAEQGQGRRQGRLHQVRIRDADGITRPHRPGDGPRERTRRRGALPSLPANA